MPKVVYICSECGKRFDKEANAIACERAHEAEKARKAKLSEEKEVRAKHIKETYKSLMQEIKSYNEDYNEPAQIPFTSTFSKLFDNLF